MSSQFNSSDGSQETPPESAFAEVPSGPRLNPRALQGLIAGAAAVAVLGGGTAGFLWLSSAPGGEDALAATPVRTPSVSVPSAGESSAVAFAASGRDIFAGTLGKNDSGVALAATAVPTDSASTSASTSTAGSKGSTGSAGGGRSTSTVKPTTGTTATPAPTTSNTPTPSRSTAAPWQQGSVVFSEILKGSSTGKFILAATGINPVYSYLEDGAVVPSSGTVYRPQGTETERPMDDDEKAACSAFVKSASAADAEKKNRETENCTVTTDFVYQAVFVPSSQAGVAKGKESFGWVVAAGATLPDASPGKVSGTVRWLGTRTDSYLVQVGNNSPQWVEQGGSVAGTPLTVVGTTLDAIERPDVAVFSDGTNQYFTILGGGEGSGVTF